MKQARTITDLNIELINKIVQLERELDAQIITAGTFADKTKMLLKVYREERNRINGTNNSLQQIKLYAMQFR